MSASIAQRSDILEKIKIIHKDFVAKALGAKFREIVEAAEGDNLLESPDGEAIIWKSGNKVFCVGTVFPSIDFLFQSINCFAASRAV